MKTRVTGGVQYNSYHLIFTPSKVAEGVHFSKYKTLERQYPHHNDVETHLRIFNKPSDSSPMGTWF